MSTQTINALMDRAARPKTISESSEERRPAAPTRCGAPGSLAGALESLTIMAGVLAFGLLWAALESRTATEAVGLLLGP